MSAQQTASRKKLALIAPPSTKWRLLSSAINLHFLSDYTFEINMHNSSPTGLKTDISGFAFADGEKPIEFTGFYDAARLISFWLTHDKTRYTFIGVFSPLAPSPPEDYTPMGGIIISSPDGDGEDDDDTPEDEGSWSATAPPHF